VESSNLAAERRRVGKSASEREAIGRSMGQQEAAHIGECREASRIAVGEEADRIAGCQDLIRSRD